MSSWLNFYPLKKVNATISIGWLFSGNLERQFYEIFSIIRGFHIFRNWDSEFRFRDSHGSALGRGKQDNYDWYFSSIFESGSFFRRQSQRIPILFRLIFLYWSIPQRHFLRMLTWKNFRFMRPHWWSTKMKRLTMKRAQPILGMGPPICSIKADSILRFL